ncbi:MAG: peptidylprolyl isomerase [Gammaproteobacteria bacterium]|nr:peptidylprolyl isomerase [Gammaproteobacteria bacterium]
MKLSFTTLTTAAGLFGLLFQLSATAAESPINSIAAIVNDEVITTQQLNTQISTIKKQIRDQNTRVPPDGILRKQVLEREIIKKVQLQLAQNTGIRVDDNDLAETLTRIAGQNKLNLREFKNTLEQDGYKFSAFREDIRGEMILARLRQREVNNRVNISEQEIENFLSTQATQGNIDDEFDVFHILISSPEAASSEQIAATQKKAQKVLKLLDDGANFNQTAISYSDGQKALEGGALGWRKAGQLPTLFSRIIASMKPGEHSGLIRSPSGFHIIQLKDKRSGKKHMVTQTKARHILISPNELTTEIDVINRLRNLRERILSGGDFAEIAKLHSEDRGSAALGGDLGWVSPGQMVPQFEAAMDSLGANEVSEPFQSQFGWHIVQVSERRDLDNSKDFTTNKARELIRQRKISETTETWLRQLREEAFVDIKITL